ncbi:tRNA pseudouridine(38-40) synthase TruA [Haloparvum sedimenti]|uniref:tRNA pseudouridine(38-40) synthase TruA n=1 Tax=Haloparvum sedimenti TaxID=1678448 RepID=UPI0009B5AFD1|nr:tRNA pseudouridine(38-40) synthase TruA [Haloparvum sedimenti]
MRAFRIAYDGRPFSGFQRQPQVPTVEGTLFDALRDHGVLGADDHRPPGYAAAGRTDAGVSAVGQTVAFDAPDWLTPRAFNGQLPGTVRAWASAEVPEGFHAQHHAARRVYRYYLHAPRDPRSGSPAGRIDAARVRAALDRLSGSHDFANFTPDDEGTVRDLSAGATREGDALVIEFAADGFPRAFVRRAVTLVRAVGTGDADLADVDRALDTEPLTGRRAFGAAPPEPLVLWEVAYDDPAVRDGLASPDFSVDREAAESARVAFAERHVDARTAARVTGAISDRVGPEADDG